MRGSLAVGGIQRRIMPGISTTARRPRVLFLVDGYPVPEDPLDCVFLRDQAFAIASAGGLAGVAFGRTCSPRQWVRHPHRLLRGRVVEDDAVPVYQTESFVATTRSTRLLARARCRSAARAMALFERRFGRPDILHAHCAAFAGETAVALGRACGIPVVLTEHYSFLPALMEAYGDRLRRVYETADRVLAVSESLARRMMALGVACDVQCMPNTVDTKTFSFMPVDPPADGTWRLLTVARDHEVKDLPTLLDALRRLARELPFTIDIVGSGEYRRARAMSGGSGLGARVRFVGPLSRPALACRMRSCHLVVSSSRMETFGMSLAEALCVGRPVVATDSGGPHDIVRSGDGRLVPVGEADALAAAMADVLRRYEEFDLAAIAASARARFGSETFSARMLGLYHELIERVPVRPRCTAASRHVAAPHAVDRHTRTSVIIATADRPGPLRGCLRSLAAQTRLPDEIIIADASCTDATADLVRDFAFPAGCELRHHRCARRGASAQRNEGIDRARGGVVFFLDDDVVCEPAFVEEILAVFAADERGVIGGVSGTITNQTFVRPSWISRLFMRWMAGRRLDDRGGYLIGPAWNHLPADAGDGARPVEWLPSGCTAYRAEALREHRFNDAFGQYSFAEDVHLSALVGRRWKLMNTSRARVYHHDLGTKTHRAPRELGRRQVVNRWVIMKDVLGRVRMADRLRLAALQVYFSVAEARRCLRTGGWRTVLRIWLGRAEGCWQVLCDR